MPALASSLYLLGRVLLSLVLLGCGAWGALALGYRLETALLRPLLASAWALGALALLGSVWLGRTRLALGLGVLAMALLLVWWHSLQPSNQRPWADDVARMLSGRVEDGVLYMDNVRNFHWRSEEDHEVVWESRRYPLDGLRSVDLFTSYWGMPAIAHVIVSFGFEDGRFLAFSVEIRRERGEQFSELGGFFKQFELSVVAADERDIVQVRSNVRDEDVYLYRVALPPEAARALLLAYVEQANALTREPRFYNTITANCTTLVFHMMRGIIQGLPMDYRLLLTGYLPSYVFEQGGLQPGYTLEQLRQHGRIAERARGTPNDADFSARIRAGVPGWDGLPVPSRPHKE